MVEDVFAWFCWVSQIYSCFLALFYSSISKEYDISFIIPFILLYQTQLSSLPLKNSTFLTLLASSLIFFRRIFLLHLLLTSWNSNQMLERLRNLINRISFRNISSNSKEFNLIITIIISFVAIHNNILLFRLWNCKCLIGKQITKLFNLYTIPLYFINIIWNDVDIAGMFLMINQFIIIILNRKVSKPSSQISSTIFHLNLSLPHIPINLISNPGIYHRFSILNMLLKKVLSIMYNHISIDILICVSVLHA